MAHDNITSIESDEQAISAQTCLLTTFNRTDGRPHEIEMRFALDGDNLYLLSEEGGAAQWVQNLLSNPEVSVRMGGVTFAGMGRVLVNNPAEEERCRQLLSQKYGSDDRWLSPGAPDALAVVVELRP